MSIFKRKRKSKFGWFGNYDHWDELVRISQGYEAAGILEKTRDALLQVKEGKAVYERDSVVFDEKVYPHAVISAMLYAAAESDNYLSVVDFGGSLGSTYFQVRDLIPPKVSLSWSVVEQEHYVREGQSCLEDEHLKFHFTLEESILATKPNVLLLSSVVQYLPKPHLFLEDLRKFDFEYIIVDRTSFISEGQADRLTLQIVPPDIYEAQYPCWFLNESQFLTHFQHYRMVMSFDSFVPGERDFEIDHQKAGYSKGFFLVKNGRI